MGTAYRRYDLREHARTHTHTPLVHAAAARKHSAADFTVHGIGNRESGDGGK